LLPTPDEDDRDRDNQQRHAGRDAPTPVETRSRRLQRVDELLHRGPALGGGGAQPTEESPAHPVGDDRCGRRADSTFAERRPAVQRLVKSPAEAELVRVGRRRSVILRGGVALLVAREPEVGDAHAAVPGDHDVARLEVAMDQPRRVGGHQAARRL
jgi:hypothetical protein